MMYMEQIRNAGMSPNGRRYHPDLIRWAIELYSRSPAAYQHLRSSAVMTLPTTSTIKRYRNYISPMPGINPVAIQEIERVQQSTSSSLIGYLSVDEMKIFYVRTLKGEVSLPLAWYPTKVTAAFQLAMKFWDALYECENRGLQIHAVVADGCSVNRHFFKLVCGVDTIELDAPLSAPNPCAPDRPIFMCSDPSHLLKTVRNSLYSSKPAGTKYLNMFGNDVLWTHILELYNVEKSSTVLSRT
uniref:Transposable element P transposase n=1 Tax=Ciona savignyi TaxID=51511 RepID=H2ZF09_CIOSA